VNLLNVIGQLPKRLNAEGTAQVQKEVRINIGEMTAEVQTEVRINVGEMTAEVQTEVRINVGETAVEVQTEVLDSAIPKHRNVESIDRVQVEALNSAVEVDPERRNVNSAVEVDPDLERRNDVR
jgi:hypothetical protein